MDYAWATIFGKKKAENPGIMNILAMTVRRYDILFIQEIRDRSGKAIVALLDLANNRCSYTGLNPIEHYVFDDGPEGHVLNRFTLVGIHIDPDVAVQELNDLHAHVMPTLKGRDVLILGDLNADCGYLPEYKRKELSLVKDSDYAWLVPNRLDTTVAGTDCEYDRFITKGPNWDGAIKEDRVWVYKFDTDYLYIGGMPEELALDVSDHYPIEIVLQGGYCENCVRYVKYVITDVTVLLSDQDKALIKGVKYDLRDNLVYDEVGAVVARLRTEGNRDELNRYKALSAIEIIKAEETSEAITLNIEYLRRKWGEQQSCTITISVQTKPQLLKIVEGELNHWNVKYEKT
ncbi:DNAS1-like protein [Mya arenaria]|uniref:DNAS1-like protein n=1 Tax=Mya arenaria TaxID=6604 RepID=A0ABY7DED2_MYAAR|nr:DNAS1-like protein [Mya arenaria]